MIDWASCNIDPYAWLGFRDFLLEVFVHPFIFLPLVAFFAWLFILPFSIGRRFKFVWYVTLILLSCSLYFLPATQAFSSLLQTLVPGSVHSINSTAVLLGRGSLIADETTKVAARLYDQGIVNSIYISGDSFSTASKLLALGLPSYAIHGDSCAQTTWENASMTSGWLLTRNLKSITLITDSWQMARASRSFVHLGVSVYPFSVFPSLPYKTEQQLILRETLAYFLYWLQGRI